jgi:hypothetical protein
VMSGLMLVATMVVAVMVEVSGCTNGSFISLVVYIGESLQGLSSQWKLT